MAKLFPLPSILLAATLGVGAMAQPRDPINPLSWLTPPAPPRDQTLPVQPVLGVIVPEERRAAAAGLLTKVQFVEVSYAEARLLGADSQTILGTVGYRTFLVRGVSPNNAGTCNANLQGSVLSVFCGSLGDFSYELRPVIVFLHQEPGSVSIGAMTAH